MKHHVLLPCILRGYESLNESFTVARSNEQRNLYRDLSVVSIFVITAYTAVNNYFSRVTICNKVVYILLASRPLSCVRVVIFQLNILIIKCMMFIKCVILCVR